MNAPDFASIGECMIELSEPRGAGSTRRTFGGDTLNTAVYAARSLKGTGHAVHYVTLLGDDPYSSEMLDAWQAEGINTALVERLPGALPGLYMIRTDENGERSFHYWRAQAAARQLFTSPGAGKIIEALAAARMVYFSGITLGILPDEGRAALFSLLQTVRARGGAVAFDSNYRPRLWSDAETARRVIGEALLHAAIALPSFDDEAMLFGDADPAATAARLQGAGVPEVVVTSGADGCFVAQGEQQMPIAAPRVEAPCDTTAAGDAFNGAYLAARLQGIAPEIAAERGMALAARVIQYPGAIMPREDA